MALLKMALRFKFLVPFICKVKSMAHQFHEAMSGADTQMSRDMEHNKMNNFES